MSKTLWDRACKASARWTKKKTGREWHDDHVSDFYMQYRNGYIAGYRAAMRDKRRK